MQRQEEEYYNEYQVGARLYLCGVPNPARKRSGCYFRTFAQSLLKLFAQTSKAKSIVWWRLRNDVSLARFVSLILTYYSNINNYRDIVNVVLLYIIFAWFEGAKGSRRPQQRIEAPAKSAGNDQAVTR